MGGETYVNHAMCGIDAGVNGLYRGVDVSAADIAANHVVSQLQRQNLSVVEDILNYDYAAIGGKPAPVGPLLGRGDGFFWGFAGCGFGCGFGCFEALFLVSLM